MLVEAGKSGRIGFDLQSHAAYYAAHYYSARCYARDYLMSLADDYHWLQDAALCYQVVAEKLGSVWENTQEGEPQERAKLVDFANKIREAKAAEKEGIELIGEHLKANTS